MKVIIENLDELEGVIQLRLKESVKESLPEISGIIASSIEENFIVGGRWDGKGNLITLNSGGSKKWKPLASSTKENYRHKGLSQERTLQRSAAGLASSIEVRADGVDSIRISANKRYAGIQNFGGTVQPTIPVTDKMRKYFWAKFFETGEDKYKGMALTKKTEFKPKIVIPASPFLVVQLEDMEDIGDAVSKRF